MPDLIVPMSEHRSFKYFKEETLQKYSEQYGWQLIDNSNRKNLFMEMVQQMDISYRLANSASEAEEMVRETLKKRGCYNNEMDSIEA